MNGVQHEILARFWTVAFNNTHFLRELTNKFYICLFFRYIMLLTYSSCNCLWHQRPFQLFMFVKLKVYYNKFSYKFLRVCSVFCRTYLILSYSQTHPQGNHSPTHQAIQLFLCLYFSITLILFLYQGYFVSSENLISMCLFSQKVSNEIKQGWFQSRPWGAPLVTLFHSSHCAFQY